MTVTSGACSAEGVTQDGQRMTYVPGTVTGVAAGADGHSIDIGYTAYNGSGFTLSNSASAPDVNNPGLAVGYGNNAQGYRTLGQASATVGPIAGAEMQLILGGMLGALGSAMPEAYGAIPEILTPAENTAVKGVLKQIANGTTKGREFFNADGELPSKPTGYYRRYTAPLSGQSGPGTSRVVVGQGGEVYYSPNHYGSFTRVQ